MPEVRALVGSLARVRQKLDLLGAVPKGSYSCKNVIFRSGLSRGYLRMRVYFQNNWVSKPIVVVHKEARTIDFGKTDVIVFRQEFDREAEGLLFIRSEFPGFRRVLEFNVVGEEFSLADSGFFLEDVEFVGPTVEIEANTEAALKNYVALIGAGKLIECSLPEYIIGLQEK